MTQKQYDAVGFNLLIIIAWLMGLTIVVWLMGLTIVVDTPKPPEPKPYPQTLCELKFQEFLSYANDSEQAGHATDALLMDGLRRAHNDAVKRGDPIAPCMQQWLDTFHAENIK